MAIDTATLLPRSRLARQRPAGRRRSQEETRRPACRRWQWSRLQIRKCGQASLRQGFGWFGGKSSEAAKQRRRNVRGPCGVFASGEIESANAGGAPALPGHCDRRRCIPSRSRLARKGGQDARGPGEGNAGEGARASSFALRASEDKPSLTPPCPARPAPASCPCCRRGRGR